MSIVCLIGVCTFHCKLHTEQIQNNNLAVVMQKKKKTLQCPTHQNILIAEMIQEGIL